MKDICFSQKELRCLHMYAAERARVLERDNGSPVDRDFFFTLSLKLQEAENQAAAIEVGYQAYLERLNEKEGEDSNEHIPNLSHLIEGKK